MIDTISKLFRDFSVNKGDLEALLSKDKSGVFQPTTWRMLYEVASRFGAGLLSLGAKKPDHIGIISDNRKEWIVADLGILGIGCADVPRGSDSTAVEISYILKHADCSITLVENQVQMDKVLVVKGSLPGLKTIIVMDPDYQQTSATQTGVRILTFQEILDRGGDYLKKNPDCFETLINASEPADLVTIIYTSGTTGEPKGVMLTNANYMHQIKAPLVPLEIVEGDIFLSVLPIWHSYERALEYVAFFAGCTLAYSKPISQVLMDDMAKVRPTIFPSVPRIWEKVKQGIYRKVAEEGGVKKILFDFFVRIGSAHSRLHTMFRGLKPQFKKRYRIFDAVISVVPLILLTPLNLLGQALVFSKLKKRLGGRFKFGVSGGGALPKHVDEFFAAAGILLLEGYGLTETSPIVSARESRKPVPQTIGPPLPEVLVRVVDENGNTLGPGEKGVLHIKGPNIMLGYYKRPEETSKTISEDGWLNSGDLAMLTHRGEIKILGRVKETIVLLGGENIEPTPIEDTICESAYIDQVMVVGQDQRHLGALVVPNQQSIEEYAHSFGIGFNGYEALLADENINHLVMDEINARINPKKGFKLFERIHKAKLLAKVFEPGDEMTHSLKLKRNVIEEKYVKEIMALFK